MSSETKQSLQKKLLQERYDKKMKAILKRKMERDVRRREELAREMQAKFKEQIKTTMLDPFENYKAVIPQPYLKDEDVEYAFENIFREYTDVAALKAQGGGALSHRIISKGGAGLGMSNYLTQ